MFSTSFGNIMCLNGKQAELWGTFKMIPAPASVFYFMLGTSKLCSSDLKLCTSRPKEVY